MKEFPLVRISAATGLERGRQYGSQAAEAIRLCIEAYKKHLNIMGKITWEHARDEAESMLPLLKSVFPELLEEMRGIAEGALQDMTDILVLNCRYELLHYPKNECTTFALLKEATRDRKVYVGQNWDNRPVMLPHTILLHITEEETGNRIMGLTEAGQLIRNGMNSAGLGMTASGLKSTLDRRGAGIPGNFLRRRLLTSRSLREMTELAGGLLYTVANNYCLASAAENTAVDVEGIPGVPALFYPVNGVLTHANNIISDPALCRAVGPKFRRERLFELLNSKAGEITPEYIKDCLRDHQNHPRSLCAHLRPGREPDDNWQTNASMIYNLSDLTLDICYGPPCEGEYRQYRL